MSLYSVDDIINGLTGPGRNKVFTLPNQSKFDFDGGQDSLSKIISDTFLAHGYTLIGDRETDTREIEQTPGLLALDKTSYDQKVEGYWSNLKLAQEIGADIPQEINIQDIIKFNGPLVAKRIDKERGEGKYLLNTKEDKLRFLTWSFCWMEIAQLDRRDQEKFNLEFVSIVNESRSIIEKFYNNELLNADDNLKIDKWLNRARQYYFQEFIQPIEGVNTSFRILIDWTGKIHYITKLENIQREEEHPEAKGLDILDSIEKSNRIIPEPHVFLFQKMLSANIPNPLFIKNTKFVSNFIQGGKSSNIFSRYLDNLNVIPDYLSKHIPIFRKLANVFQKYTPILGLDFIPSNNGKLYFLEWNLPKIFEECFPQSIRHQNLLKLILEEALKES